MDCRPPGSFCPLRILQGRILEWVAMPSSRASSQSRDWTQVSHRWILYLLSHQGSPRILEWVAFPSSRGSSHPRNQTGVSCIAGRFFTSGSYQGSPSIFISTSQSTWYGTLQKSIQKNLLDKLISTELRKTMQETQLLQYQNAVSREQETNYWCLCVYQHTNQSEHGSLCTSLCFKYQHKWVSTRGGSCLWPELTYGYFYSLGNFLFGF